jgi:hypothetical protein
LFNERLALSAARVDATLSDLHARFQRGDPSWVTQLIERSSRGASAIRGAFLPAVLCWARAEESFGSSLKDSASGDHLQHLPRRRRSAPRRLRALGRDPPVRDLSGV